MLVAVNTAIYSAFVTVTNAESLKCKIDHESYIIDDKAKLF